MDQDAVVVRTIAPKSKGPKGLTGVPNGLPEDRPQFDPSKYFRVIVRDRATKDENLNERIQREGAHFSGAGNPDQPLTGGEAEWYMRNKGYTNRLGL